MNFTFPWPYSPGEWLAWIGAALTMLFGILHLLVPQVLGTAPSSRGGSRSLLGGFYAGIGLSAILFAQPFTYAALCLGWALAALGQVFSILFDKGSATAKLPMLVGALFMAALPFLFLWGYVS